MSVIRPIARLISPLVNPVVFDFWAAHLSPALSWERPLAKVVAREVVARDTVTLILRPNRHVQQGLPGQHVNVTAAVEGVRLTRSYSPDWSSRRRLALTIKRVPEGRMSSWLTQRCRVGDVLEIGPAFGDMTPPDPAQPWLFLAAGSGITPLISLLRHAAEQRASTAPITLLYWARTRADLCFLNELGRLHERLPGFRLHTILTREASLLPHERAGRPDAALLAELVPALDGQLAYACGPAGFVGAVREGLAGKVASFSAEAFTPPALSPVTESQPVRVTLARSGRELTIPAGMALLPALEAAGERPAYGCRMGICNTCACGKLAGSTEDLLGGGINPEPVAALRLCVSRARGDISLDL